MKVIEVEVGVDETKLDFLTGGAVVGVGPWHNSFGTKIPLVCISRNDAEARIQHIKIVEGCESFDLAGFIYIGTSRGKSWRVYHVFIKDEK